MANILPDGWRALQVTGAAAREIETLAELAEALPDAYTVYHAVHWTQLEHGFSVYGEIDFVVVNPAGDLLLIEQKSGFLVETADGLVKRYAEKEKRVPIQLARTVAALRGKLHARPGCQAAHVDYLLYCPDYTVRQVETAGIAPQRIVDARRKTQLGAIIQGILPAAERASQATEVHRFLRGVLQLETDVSALVGHARALVTRVSGGLAHWARQLEFTPHRLRVIGTAGSGKTQLALAEFAAALAVGRRPLYVCYNRPLADHFSHIAPAGGWVGTFHMLCDQRLREQGVPPDFTQPDAFERLIDEAAALPPTEAWRFDCVIVDEGQDFTEAWRDLVLRHARPQARLLWLEDPMQNLYARPPVALPGWVSLHARGNYRSPRPVVRFLQSLLPEGAGLEAAGPLGAGGLELLVYRDAVELKERVKEAIRLCYAAGYRRDDLALLSFRGREQSLLFPYSQLGPHTLRTFTGRYDLLGHPLFSEGDVLLETVYRFKGQSAAAVVFAEIDFEELDEKALRKLFVGATRAMMMLVLVVSERAAGQLRISDFGFRM
ncbi:MAG: ATP-binding domain-containing protein [Pseudomonadota bacterium]|nr:ATP-binding domain-containing protein [Pseudomonadota bacterium]MDP1905558.1 ATP-binding domain-containing protein [Pseudomonadota bacterium]MDP2352447.1 ATP-binding domain-containing protein [Pseudomonadota bacterium]